jgi:hypothetical protein
VSGELGSFTSPLTLAWRPGVKMWMAQWAGDPASTCFGHTQLEAFQRMVAHLVSHSLTAHLERRTELQPTTPTVALTVSEAG